ncbi:Ig-like domain-containing protein [Microvirga sp. 2TAF3]|uniref:Ig-like domain-containing protein n=1 Tax=Microvirga sp. 2TAF3 TaxID=3233014 RepID=UPI003F95F2B6
MFYDNQLEDAPEAAPDSYDIKAGTLPSGKNVLSNDVDLDKGGPLGVVDLQAVTHINGVAANIGQWNNLAGGGRALLNSNGIFQFADSGDFADLAQDATRTTSFNYIVTDSAGRSDIDEDSLAPMNDSTAGSTSVTAPIGATGISNFSDVDDEAAASRSSASATRAALPLDR